MPALGSLVVGMSQAVHHVAPRSGVNAEGAQQRHAGDHPARAELDRGDGPVLDAELDRAVVDADELCDRFIVLPFCEPAVSVSLHGKVPQA